MAIRPGKKKPLLGIMQGRLVPPVEERIQAFPIHRWAEEFSNAAEAGLDSIEWIYDAYGMGENPLESDDGIERIAAASRNSGVTVRSLCADYFMDFPVVRATEAERTERIARLEWLLGQAARLGIVRVVLPFVDNSAIRDEKDCDSVIDTLRRVLPTALSVGIELHLETSLEPERFSALLARLPQQWLKVNYDSGNSASLGFRPSEEFAAYGERIGSVHIKDRALHGPTKPLGEGDADLDSVFAGLNQLDYSGDFVLQVARGTAGKEVEWARQNRVYVERYLK
jgi:L-ribulose-5-phosphate 3-epimerase